MNRLLLAIGDEDRANLLRDAEHVELPFKQTVFLPGRPIEHIYFPDAGVVSIVADNQPEIVEVATIGREGIVGLQVFLGTSTVALHGLVQVPGNGWRMTAGAFERHIGSGGQLHQVLSRYTQALFFQIAQNAACNRIHDSATRCARWLMMTLDRVDGTDVPLTQEFLGQMLGVRRSTVNEALGALAQRGLVEQRRGVIRVLDPAGLLDASCACYSLMIEEYERLVPADADASDELSA